MARQPLPPATDRAVAVVPQLLAIVADMTLVLQGSHGDCQPDSCQHAELLRAISRLSRYIGNDDTGSLAQANAALWRLGWNSVPDGYTPGYRYGDRNG